MLKVKNQNGLCPIPLGEFVKLCKQGKCPAEWLGGGIETIGDLARMMANIGAFDPLAAIRPGACDIVSVFDKTVEAPPAEDENTPSRVKLIKICAPMHLSLVVSRLRVEPANLTAVESGEIVFPRNSAFGFSEGFCLPFEPGDGNNIGTYYNVEHIILCPGSGFDVYAINHSPFSPALFHIHAEIWASC